jgi:acyl-CoA reductase-like NAD-dependent aldehyde dehydrogenase
MIVAPIVEPILSARAAQSSWAAQSVPARLEVLRRFRNLAAVRSASVAATVPRPAAETLTAEVLPLLDACRFLEKESRALLAPRRFGRSGRPVWLTGVDLEIHREPLGVVLIIGPANYPLFLPGVQALQALAAGNAVLIKPGEGGSAPMHLFRTLLCDAGLHPHLVHVLDESTSQVDAVIAGGVDKVFLTGSASTGRAVMRKLATDGVPSVMELSGDDSVFVLPGAEPDRVEKAVRFGVTLNSGNTCIAPHRVITVCHPEVAARLRCLLPVIETSTEDEALAAACNGYALGASVFGPEPAARRFAARIDAGVVVVNDIIVPTADPRLPFGGRRASGFGVTRGAEGLLEMTALKAISVRTTKWLPHLEAPAEADGDLFAAFTAFLHAGSIRDRLRGLRGSVHAARRRRTHG